MQIYTFIMMMIDDILYKSHSHIELPKSFKKDRKSQTAALVGGAYDVIHNTNSFIVFKANLLKIMSCLNFCQFC